jgi:hypothetical protein
MTEARAGDVAIAGMDGSADAAIAAPVPTSNCRRLTVGCFMFVPQLDTAEHLQPIRVGS